MSDDLWGTVIVAASLSRFVTLGEWHAREYLTTLSDTDANSLWKCLRRLGWWFPDDQRSPQERLVWWLFRDDVMRLDSSDGTERQRIETPEERLADAVRHLKSLAGAATIPSGSCLSVAGFVRCVLLVLERNELPLGCQSLPWGSPDDFRFDVCRIRFDGECLNDAMNAVAIQLDLRPGRLDWQVATGHPSTTERRAFADVLRLFTGWRDELEREIQARGELPPGWEAADTNWPDCPIKTVEHLREWLSSWLRDVHQARSSSRSWSNPESYLDDVQRELRNTWWAMRAWGIALPTEFNDKPADIHEAERQLVLLIDTPPAGDATTEANSEPPKPVEPQAETRTGGDGIGRAEAVGKPAKGTGHRRNSKALFQAALQAHHGYKTGGSISNYEWASTRRIEELTEKGISASTAERLLKKHFGTIDDYRDACFQKTIGPKLVILLGDGLHAFGAYDSSHRDPEDTSDE